MQMKQITSLQKPKSLSRVPFVIALALLLGVARTPATPADFTVAAVDGSKAFKLSEAKGKYVALHFLLKTECPYCMKHTHDYAQKAATVAGVTQVFLKPDTDEEIKAWSEKLNANSPAGGPVIYRDPDAKLATEFGIPDGY